MGDAEDAGLAAAERLEAGMHGVEIGEAIGDLADVVDAGRLGGSRPQPHVADRLEETAGGPDLLFPRSGQVDVAEEPAVQELSEERLPTALAMIGDHVRDQLGHHSIKLTVDTYGHLVPGTNRAAVDRLDDATGRNLYIRNQ